jgi:CheY-like chemotaxis protein
LPEPSGAFVGRVLLAEDDREFRRLVANTLRNDGYEVIEASDGVALLEHYASALLSDADLNDVFDLIVTDVRMPGGPV